MPDDVAVGSRRRDAFLRWKETFCTQTKRRARGSGWQKGYNHGIYGCSNASKKRGEEEVDVGCQAAPKSAKEKALAPTVTSTATKSGLRGEKGSQTSGLKGLLCCCIKKRASHTLLVYDVSCCAYYALRAIVQLVVKQTLTVTHLPMESSESFPSSTTSRTRERAPLLNERGRWTTLDSRVHI